MELNDHWTERGRGRRGEREKAAVVGAPRRKRFGAMSQQGRREDERGSGVGGEDCEEGTGLGVLAGPGENSKGRTIREDGVVRTGQGSKMGP